MNNKIIVVVFIAFLAVSCAKLPIYQATKINNKNDIFELKYYDEDSKLLYDIFDDEQNIYVNIKTTDFYSQVKILEMGLTLWINQDVKKKKNKGITFPQKQNFKNQQVRKMRDKDSFNREEQRIEQLHAKFEMFDKNILLIGMNGENSKTILNPELEKSDIMAKITFGKFNQLNYLATIPKDKIFIDEKQSNDIFVLGIESGSMEMNNRQNQGQGGRSGGGMKGGGGRSGGGMKGGGGRPSGKMGGNFQEYSNLSEPIKIWLSVDLSEN